MRKTYVYASLLVAVVGFLFFFAGSCTTSDGLPPYYIKFTIDGEEVVFDLGLSNIEEDPFASVTNVGDGIFNTLFFARPLTDDEFGMLDTYILIRIQGEDPTFIVYPRTYTYPPGVDDSLEIVYEDSGSGYYYTLNSGSLTVTSFGEVGEAITGTFSATLSYILIPQGVKVAAPTIQVTEGEFKVKRVDDGYSSPFPD